MQYFEVPRPSGDGLCSDKACPCPETAIPRGSGYLYISQELVDFRKDCLTYAQLQKKLDNMAKSDPLNNPNSGGFVRFLPAGTTSPIMMCEQGAKLRGLDLKTAGADARHWWKTGLVPLRVTPLAIGSSVSPKSVLDKLEEQPFIKRAEGRKACAACNYNIPSGSVQCPECGSGHFIYIPEKAEASVPAVQQQRKPFEKTKMPWQFRKK